MQKLWMEPILSNIPTETPSNASVGQGVPRAPGGVPSIRSGSATPTLPSVPRRSGRGIVLIFKLAVRTCSLYVHVEDLYNFV